MFELERKERESTARLILNLTFTWLCTGEIVKRREGLYRQNKIGVKSNFIWMPVMNFLERIE